MERTRDDAKMMGRRRDENLNALLAYIKELEISLERKDELLAAKDRRIGALEAEVSWMKGPDPLAASIFRSTASAKASTPRTLPVGNQLSSATPNQVSDDSGELEERTYERSLSLSHISYGHSFEDAECAASDGRWNIPFDGSLEDLVAKSTPSERAGPGSALRDVGFVPIEMEGRGPRSGGAGVTPVRPVARICYQVSPFAHVLGKGLLEDVMKEKENVSPRKSDSLGTLRGIR